MESFIFSDQHVASNIDDLISLCHEHPDSGVCHLMEGNFESWLRYIGRNDLADTAAKARTSSNNPNECLTNFINNCLFEKKSFIQKIQSFLTRESRKKFTFLLIGRSGVGKSSTINTLLGQNEAKVGKFRPTTDKTKAYEAKLEGISYVVVDTPGLADATNKEQQYLDSIAAVVTEFDLMFFVTILSESRVRDDEVTTIRLITQALGKEAWERSVIVFTYADKVSQKEYLEYLTERTAIIQETIAEFADSKIAQDIPSIAVANDPYSNLPLPTPVGGNWLGALYLAVFKRISDKGKMPFLLATSKRISQDTSTNPDNNSQSTQIVFNENQKQELKKAVEKSMDFNDVVTLT